MGGDEERGELTMLDGRGKGGWWVERRKEGREGGELQFWESARRADWPRTLSLSFSVVLFLVRVQI